MPAHSIAVMAQHRDRGLRRAMFVGWAQSFHKPKSACNKHACQSRLIRVDNECLGPNYHQGQFQTFREFDKRLQVLQNRFQGLGARGF